MQTRGRNERLAESGGKMILHGLRVAGESGRARASLGESRLSIEFKNGNCIDIRYDQISRMQHHNTTLIPGWVAFVGFCLLYASWRVISPPNIRLLGLGLGLAMVSGWILTKRPTLTLDTELRDCHVLHAIDSRLLKLSTMIQRMQDGLTLEEARIGVELINEDTEFPRHAAQIAAEAIPAPMKNLEPARSLSNFLGEPMSEGDEFEIDEDMPRWAKDSMRQDNIISDEFELHQHGFIQRGIANARSGRGHVSPLDIEPTPSLSQTHEPHFSGDQPLPIPMHQQTMSSARMIQEARGTSSEPVSQPYTPVPTRFVQSYVGPDSAPISSNPDAFISPDLPLYNNEPSTEEQAPSLVEQGLVRNATPQNQNAPARRGLRRDSRGQPRILQRKKSTNRRVVSSRKDSNTNRPRRFSSMLDKVRDRIHGLSEEGIDTEIIELLGEHIPEDEEEKTVPSSFSALTDSREVAPVQTSQHGLRRID